MQTVKYHIAELPLTIDLESNTVLKKALQARAALAELKGVSGIIPNKNILINTLALQEAKDSSAIENIITTQDELYESNVLARQFTTPAAKEVYNYVAALKQGYECIQTTGLLKNSDILSMQATLIGNNAGFRKLPGTALKNEQTGAIIYEPPQNGHDITDLMKNLENFINQHDLSQWDPLVKMAVMHHQFESIHPFYDGNGRTGRILNILYLVQQGLLDTPVLYLSRYINQHKAQYYQLLQAVRDKQQWQAWVLFMLEGVEQTAIQTTALIHDIQQLMLHHKQIIRVKLPKIYSQDLLNHMFYHPYTKTTFLESTLRISRITATRYLNELHRIGLMEKFKLGRDNYYINIKLIELLSQPKSA